MSEEDETRPEGQPEDEGEVGEADAPEAAATSGKTSKGGGIWRKLRKRALQFLLILVLLLVAFGIFSQTSYFQNNILRPQVEAATNDAIEGSLEIGSIEGNLFTHVAANNVVVYDKKGNLAASIQRAEVAYDLLPLIDFELPISRVKLVRPLGIVRTDKDGVLNLATLVKPSDAPEEEGKPFGLSIANIDIERGVLFYMDERELAPNDDTSREAIRDVEAFLSDASLLADGKASAYLQTQLRALNTATIGPVPGAAIIDDISVQGNFSLNKAAMMTVDLSSFGATLDANTWVEEQRAESKNLEVKYSAEVVRITHERLSLGKESGWENLKLGANLLPPPADDPEKAPEPLLFHASSPSIVITRELILAVAPSIDIRDGVRTQIVAAGTPQDARAMIKGELIESGGKFHAYGRIEKLLSQLLAGTLSFEKANESRPSYVVDVDLRGFDPGAVAPDVPRLLLDGNLHIEGSGVTIDSADVTALLDMGKTKALEQYELRSARIEASFKDRTLTIAPSHIRSPYLDADLEGTAELGGKLDLKAKVVADETHDRSVTIPGLGTVSQEHLFLDMTAKGSLDVEASDPLVMTKQADIDITWDIKALQVVDDKIGASKAKLDLSLTSPSEDRRLLDYDIDLVASGVDAPTADVRAELADVDAKGTMIIPVPLEDPLSLLDRLTANANVRVRGLNAPGIRLSSTNAKLTLEPNGNGRMRYSLDAALGGLRLPDASLSLGGGSTNLAGTFSLDSKGSPNYLSAKGKAKVRALDASGAKVGEGEVELDVAGIPPNLRGKADIDARDIAIGDQELEDAKLAATIRTDNSFDIKGGITRKDAEPKRLAVRASGKLGEDLDEVRDLEADLYNLDAKDDEPIWKIKNATVVARGGEVRFEDVELVNDEQRLMVVGTYRERGEQDLTASATNIDLGQLRSDLGLQNFLPDIEGQIETIDFKLSGTSAEPEVELDVIIKEFMYEGTGPFKLILKGRYRNSKLTVNRMELEGWEQQLVSAQARVPVKLDLEGNFDIFWREPILMSLLVPEIDLGKLTPKIKQLEDYIIRGVVKGGGIINGTLEKPLLDLNVGVASIGFKSKLGKTAIDMNSFALSSRFSYEPPSSTGGGFKTLTKLKAMPPKYPERDLVTIEAESPLPIAEWLYRTIERGEVVDYAKEVFAQPFAMTVKLDKIKLNQLNETGLIKAPRFTGEVDFALAAAGTFGDPSARFDLNLDDVAIRGDLEGQRVDLRKINSNIALTFGPLQGSSDQLTYTGTFAMGGYQLIDSNGFLELPLRSWFSDIAIKGKELDLVDELLSKRFDFNLTIKELDLEKIAIAPLFTEPEIAGIVNMEFSSKGIIADPVANLSLDIGERALVGGKEESKGGLGYNRYRDIVVSTRANIKSKVLTLERFSINWDSTDILSARGKIPLPVDTLLAEKELEDLPIDFDLEFHPMPLNKLGAIDYGLFGGLTGVVNGHAIGRGSLRDPRLSGRMALVDTKLSQYEKGTIAAEFEVREGLARAYTELCQDKFKMLTAEVHARLNTDVLAVSKGADPLEPPGELRRAVEALPANKDIRVKVNTRDGRPIDLARALPQKLIKKYAKDIEGMLAVNLDLSGSHEALSVQGTVKLEDGAITLESYGRRFEEIVVDTWMDSRSFNIREFSLDEGDAALLLTGSIKHENLTPGEVDLSLEADTFNFGDFVDFPFFASGDVKMTGQLDAEPMDLTVDLRGLDVALTEEISNDLHATALDEEIIILREQTSSTAQITEDEVAGADTELFGDAAGSMAALNMNVRVIIRDDSWVRHPYGDVNVKGDFTTKLSGSSLAMTGQIQTLRGQVEFLEKTFTVTRGLITFTGLDPPDPRLQIEASYILDRSVTSSLGPASDGEPRVIVAVEGSANDPVLRLRSDPSMSETDILYVLATGQPPSTADVGQDSSVASAALSAASGVVLGMLRDELSDTLPLDFFDVLRVDTSNLEVGKYVNNGKIYLSYRYLFGGADQSGESVYEFEYHFAPKWTLEAQGRDSDQGGQFNFNVFWDAY